MKDHTLVFVEGALHNCRIFVTDDHLLGLAPSEASVGDIVCTIRGAEEPCILRERPHGDWLLVSGECFFQNIHPGNKAPEYLEDHLDFFKNVDFGPQENFAIW